MGTIKKSKVRHDGSRSTIIKKRDWVNPPP